MKICPQCSSVFGDDYVYCLNDGNVLRDESGEQETLFASRVRMPTPPEQGAAVVQCPACGLLNRSNSRFCKKCGGPLAHVAGADVRGSRSEPVQPSPQYDRPLDHTVAFQSPVFTPPTGGVASRPAAAGNRNVLIGLALAAIVIIGGAIIYSKQGDPEPKNTSTNTNHTAANANKAANAVNSVVNAVNGPPSFTSNPSDPRIGRIGTLLFDSNLRAYPNRGASRLGTHYRGARIQVLETADVRNDDGGISTWFRVKALSYGVSMDPKNSGLDRDPGTPDEGWVNSYPEVWDSQLGRNARRELVALD